MAASDDAQMGAANPGLTAAASGAQGQAEAILRIANAQMAGRERWPAASGDDGEVGAMAVQTRRAAAGGDARKIVAPLPTARAAAGGEAREIVAPLPTAQAAENGERRETEAIKEAANRERPMAAGEPGPVEAAAAPTERAIAPCPRPRRFRKGRYASSGCSAPTTSRNRAESSSASPTARPPK